MERGKIAEDIAEIVAAYMGASQEGRAALLERAREIAFLYPAKRATPQNRGGRAKNGLHIVAADPGTAEGSETAAGSKRGKQ